MNLPKWPVTSQLVRPVLNMLPAARAMGPDDNSVLFAAALEAADDSIGDADAVLARELEIASMLVASRAALDPDVETRTRARQRLLTALYNRA